MQTTIANTVLFIQARVLVRPWSNYGQNRVNVKSQNIISNQLIIMHSPPTHPPVTFHCTVQYEAIFHRGSVKGDFECAGMQL